MDIEMKKIDKNEFLDKSSSALQQMVMNVENLEDISIESFEPGKSALVILDMINGFLREGALKSERIEGTVEPIVKLVKMCGKANIPIIAFADCHSEAAPEFESYPAHCIGGTSEAKLIEEIANLGGYRLIPKNSTNGFLEADFQKWLDDNPEITSFIITGDCTDICVLQFALALKAYFNGKNIRSRLVVPVNAVETYDLGEHYGELMNIVALQMMKWNGIELAGRLV